MSALPEAWRHNRAVCSLCTGLLCRELGDPLQRGVPVLGLAFVKPRCVAIPFSALFVTAGAAWCNARWRLEGSFGVILAHGCCLLQSRFPVQKLESLTANPRYGRSRGAAPGRGAGEEVGVAAASSQSRQLQPDSPPFFPALKKKVKIILLGSPWKRRVECLHSMASFLSSFLPRLCRSSRRGWAKAQRF